MVYGTQGEKQNISVNEGYTIRVYKEMCKMVKTSCNTFFI